MRFLFHLLLLLVAYFSCFWLIEGSLFGARALGNVWSFLVGLAAASLYFAWTRRRPVAFSEDGQTLIIKESRPWLHLPLSSLAGYRLRMTRNRHLDLFTRNGNTYVIDLPSKRVQDELEQTLQQRSSLPVLEHAPDPVRLILWPDGPPVMAGQPDEKRSGR